MLNQRDIRPELEKLGCNNVEHIYRNASTPQLYEEIVRNVEGNIAHLGSVPIFGFMIPKACKGVASELLNPINSTSDKDEYKKRAKKLAANFKENFKQFENKVSKEILNTMP
ncbi:MAG: hypothetical protein J7K84_04390 [Deltaproteobacteria bacterium]|nr:hypothetical protein [Deltaproteobacteria bacterium]